MTKRNIDDLVYLLNEIKTNNKPKPIVLLGAGASASAGIPLANEIIKDIISRYNGKPSIQRLNDEQRENYYELMSALSADERRDLFSSYVNDANVKLNVTHIYLAQLLTEGYLDYIFTPNFDDLLLKACMLFHKLPPVYDISHGNEFTTTNFQKESITYLHGQHFGQWLLNSKGELEKTKNSLPKLFRMVSNQRPWIIIGYSGADEILDELAKFESFDNELYWIGYKNNEPSEKVKEKLLNVPNKNAYVISGYDSDTFFLDLHSKLKIKTPQIINKPFTYLSNVISKIKEVEGYKINDEEHIQSFNFFKNRLDRNTEMTNKAIEEYEESEESELYDKIYEANLIDNFYDIEFFRTLVEKDYLSLKPLLSSLYIKWGISEMTKYSDTINNIEKIESSIDKFKKARELYPENCFLELDYAISLLILSKKTSNKNLLQECNKIFEKLYQLDSQDARLLEYFGTSLFELAKLELISNSDTSLFERSIKIFEECINLNPKNELSRIYIGISNTYLGKVKKDVKYFESGIEKLKEVLEINPIIFYAYHSWAALLIELYFLKGEKKILDEALDKSQKAYDLDKTSSYNLSCCYALKGKKSEALKYLEETLNDRIIPIEFILNDNEWEKYKEDNQFLQLIQKYSKTK